MLPPGMSNACCNLSLTNILTTSSPFSGTAFLATSSYAIRATGNAWPTSWLCPAWFPWCSPWHAVRCSPTRIWWSSSWVCPLLNPEKRLPDEIACTASSPRNDCARFESVFRPCILLFVRYRILLSSRTDGPKAERLVRSQV